MATARDHYSDHIAALNNHLKRLLLGSSHPSYHGLMLVIALYVAWRVSFPCR